MGGSFVFVIDFIISYFNSTLFQVQVKILFIHKYWEHISTCILCFVADLYKWSYKDYITNINIHNYASENEERKNDAYDYISKIYLHDISFKPSALHHTLLLKSWKILRYHFKRI